jgi:hypothetical protein
MHKKEVKKCLSEKIRDIVTFYITGDIYGYKFVNYTFGISNDINKVKITLYGFGKLDTNEKNKEEPLISIIFIKDDRWKVSFVRSLLFKKLQRKFHYKDNNTIVSITKDIYYLLSKNIK